MIWMIAIITGLVLAYMVKPPFKSVRLSAARFAGELPPARTPKFKFTLKIPNLTRSFWIQLIVMALLLIALLLFARKCSGSGEEKLGVWLVVDTSASMSTIQDKMSRMEIAQKKVRQVLKQVRNVSRDLDVCFRLSTFDTRVQLQLESGSIEDVSLKVAGLKPRLQGTDLLLLKPLMESTGNQEHNCRVTHLVVITDLPAPAWINDSTHLPVVWRNIGKKVENYGIAGIQGLRNPLSGEVSEITIEAKAYVKLQPGIRMMVKAPGGETLINEPVVWTEGNKWRKRFVPTQTGRYQVRLSPGGAYAYDDNAVIDVPVPGVLSIDWQLNNTALPEMMGWAINRGDYKLRVTSNLKETGDLPTLVVGKGYRHYRIPPGKIGAFIENNPLLEDLNLDTFDTLNIQAYPQEQFPERWKPVLQSRDGNIWVAWSNSPVMAFIPGLPTWKEDTMGRVSSTLFFNALQWLLNDVQFPALYSFAAANGTGTGKILPPGMEREGITEYEGGSLGELQHLEPVPQGEEREPLWPYFLALAVIVFVFERLAILYEVLA
jgi:hypothetical protein